MKALRFENDELKLAEVDLARRSDEALVRVTMAGICNTDIEIVRGYASFSGTLGHEFVGVVEDSPDKSQVGRRVVGEINAGTLIMEEGAFFEGNLKMGGRTSQGTSQASSVEAAPATKR